VRDLSQRFGVQINRNGVVTTHPFTDYFQGFEKIEAVQWIFGEKTDDVIRELRVEFIGASWGYMGVSNLDGHLIISITYLQNGDIRDIYLDIIHELTHVKQFKEGKQLFDRHFSYVDRPTEIEAYQNAVKEARRLGMTDSRILEYLKTEWMSDEDLKRLASCLNVKTD
jgi:hypothetical protein